MSYRKVRGMATRKRKRRNHHAIRFIPPLVVAALAIFIYVFIGTDSFAVREVEFYGSNTIPRDSLGTIKAGLMGRNMLTLPLSRVREQFMNFPEIRDVIFKRKLFHQLDCYLQKREPVALIAASDMFEVDESGFVIPSRAGGSNVDLPVITGISKGELDTREGKEKLDNALEVLRLLKAFGFSPAEQLSEIHVENDEVMLIWIGTGTLIHVGRSDYGERIRKLRAVYGVFADNPQLIDLRFDRQVVVR